VSRARRIGLRIRSKVTHEGQSRPPSAADTLFEAQAKEFGNQAGAEISIDRVDQNDIQARVTAGKEPLTCRAGEGLREESWAPSISPAAGPFDPLTSLRFGNRLRRRKRQKPLHPHRRPGRAGPEALCRSNARAEDVPWTASHEKRVIAPLTPRPAAQAGSSWPASGTSRRVVSTGCPQ
jgi:hypothetical protein